VREPADWEIRHGRDDDVEEVVELLRTCLGEGGAPRSAEFWRWKHQRNPFGPSPVLVASAGGRIVGVRAFLRWRWESGDRPIPAVRAVDTATHPDWQGRGVFSALTTRLVAEVGEEGTAFVFNTPNRKSGGGYRTMGWRVVGRLPVLVRPLGLPGARRRGGGPGELTPVAAFLARPEAEPFLAAVESRRRRDPRLRTAATADFLRWRYADPPGLDYRAAWAGSGEAAAALVLRLRRRRGLREAAVAEVLVAGEAGVATAAGLLRGLRASSRADHAVAVASPGSDEHAALRRAGFLPLPGAGPRLFVRPLDPEAEPPNPELPNPEPPNPEPPNPLQPESWRFAAGSFELF